MSKILDQEGKADSVRRGKPAPGCEVSQPTQPLNVADISQPMQVKAAERAVVLVEHLAADLDALSGRLTDLDKPADATLSSPAPMTVVRRTVGLPGWGVLAAAAVVMLVSARVRVPSVPDPYPLVAEESITAPEPELPAPAPVTLAMAPIPMLPANGFPQVPTLLVTEGIPVQPPNEPIVHAVLAQHPAACSATEPMQVVAESRVSTAIPVSVRRRRPVQKEDLYSLPTPRKSGADLFRAASL